MSEPTPQAIFGQTVALADAIVALLNARSATFCIPVSATRMFARKMDLADIPKKTDAVRVDVFPGSDLSERDGIVSCFTDTYTAHVLMQQQVGADAEGTAEDQCSRLMQLRSEIVEFLVATRLTITTAVHPFANTGVIAVQHGPEGVYDLNRLETQNVFYADVLLTYKAPGLRRQIL